MKITLADWTLADPLHPLGQGGYGTVWRGVHRRLGAPVALKVMTHPSWRTDEGRAAFRNEVLAMAVLDHPGIVRVLDHGEVGEAATVASKGLLGVGAPWLAMELVEGGSLRERRPPDWASLRAILLEILAALAHAHARGVVHGDLTPNNVLVDAAGRARLSDFGLARSLDADVPEQVETVRGTRGFMSPEHRAGRLREIGPESDLFVLGCIAWSLASGVTPPTLPPPPLVPCLPVARGFDGWLARLLQPNPAHRFAFAADAAAVLALLDETDDVALELPAADPHAVTVTVDWLADDIPEGPPVAPIGGQASLPADWCEIERPSSATVQILRLSGERPALHGLRRLPFVGRVAERDALWAALREVDAEGTPRAVVVRGPSGVGVTRLARWLAERAHEVGGARTVDVVHGPVAGPGDGLAGAVERLLRTTGIPRPAVRARVERWLRAHAADPADAATLTELLRPTGAVVADRAAVFARVLRTLARDRPLVLLVDDAHWGLEALGLVERLLRSTLPALIVVTVHDEDLEGAAAEAIAELPATTLALEPLPPADHALLVRSILGLAPEVAAGVEERTAGNPAFAVDLVGNWLVAGRLAQGAGGLVLTGDAAALPASIGAAWAERLDRVLAREPPAARVALELAAALGQDVDGTEWTAACKRVGVPFPDRAVAALLDAHLLRPRPLGVGFAHAALRTALQGGSAGRWREHQALCAALVTDPERRGRHLEAAGELEAAYVALRDAELQRRIRADYRAALALNGRVEAILVALGAPADDGRWGRCGYAEADARRLLGQHDLAEAIAKETLARAVASGWTAVHPWLLHTLATLRATRGDPVEARQLLAEALARFRENADPLGTGYCLQAIADDANNAGDHALAARLFAEAAEHCARAGRSDMVAACLVAQGPPLLVMGRYAQAERVLRDGLALAEAQGAATLLAFGAWFLAAVFVWRGEPARGEGLAREAIARIERIGNPLMLAYARSVQAHAQRRAGDLAAAELAFRELVAYFDGVGVPDRWDARTDLAWVLLAGGRTAEARALVDEVLVQPRDGLNGIGLANALVQGMVCALTDGDGARFDAIEPEARAVLERTAAADQDKADALDRAAAIALAAGDAARSERASALADDQRRRLSG